MSQSNTPETRDGITLPPVPAMAPDANPWRDRAIIAAFALGLAFPGLALIQTRTRTTMQLENRTAAPWPAVSGYRLPTDFPVAFERAFADRFGGRDALISFHHTVEAALFRTSPVPNVLLGRDGWLYYKGDDGGAFDRDFRRSAPPAMPELAAIADGITQRVRFLQAMGIDYLLVVAPDKYTIYPEHVPDELRPLSDLSPFDALLELLPPETRAHVVDLRPALRAARKERQVYSRTDSHWNGLGAWAAGKEVFAALRNDRSGTARPALPEGRVDGVMVGDLARMMGVTNGFEEPLVNPVPAPGVPPCAHDAAGAPPVYGAPQQMLYCESAPLGTVAVYHDSMGIELLFQLADYFRKSRWSSTRTWNPGEISALKPALVLEEVVERNLPLLADVSFLGVSQVAAAAGPARGWKTGQPFQAGEQAKPAQWCALDEVNAARSPRDYDLPAKGDINAQGWAGNGDDGSVPGQVWMVITDGEKAFHARVDMGQSRPDVAAAIGKPSLATAGYRLDGSLEGIPPGSYRVALVWARPDGWMSCDTRRILNVGAEKR